MSAHEASTPSGTAAATTGTAPARSADLALTHDTLARALRDAVLAQDFGATPDSQDGGKPMRHFPSLDLAVVVYPERGAPVWANVLFSREHPEGLIARIPADAGPVGEVRFVADTRDAEGNSIAWRPDSDWSAMRWTPLAGDAGPRMVAPYPASLLKLMLLAGLGRLVDQGRASWWQPLSYRGRERLVADWAYDMITWSSNEATSALVTLMHATGAIRREDGREVRNDLHRLFESLGLTTLRFANTVADGGWGNGAGSGVGQLQMTAWDTVRLLWWLDPTAPAAPWLRADAPRLSPESRNQMLHALEDQALHEVLSSGALGGVPGWVPGLPSRLPGKWLQPDGSLHAGEVSMPGDLRRFAAGGDVRFAHKTGNTENYVSNAGIVRGISPRRRHYAIALLTNLGARYAPDERCATTWRVPALGAAIDARLAAWLET
ncbi:MAG: hypothetical protein J7598_15035 [Mitsuaria chitosanitabida]|jgi:hypothetical protein|uniref:serine hydrolase n=1 Tax=Roseateles chitosanitabidus TaxID=65048 RepID=UPI001B2AB892|nr:serine hydrolase [Roseateles chitosanitabidus]MBO9687919.1 hypothetical protein [Roseateles chitosanitabidus]